MYKSTSIAKMQRLLKEERTRLEQQLGTGYEKYTRHAIAAIEQHLASAIASYEQALALHEVDKVEKRAARVAKHAGYSGEYDMAEPVGDTMRAHIGRARVRVLRAALARHNNNLLRAAHSLGMSAKQARCIIREFSVARTTSDLDDLLS